MKIIFSYLISIGNFMSFSAAVAKELNFFEVKKK